MSRAREAIPLNFIENVENDGPESPRFLDSGPSREGFGGFLAQPPL